MCASILSCGRRPRAQSPLPPGGILSCRAAAESASDLIPRPHLSWGQGAPAQTRHPRQPQLSCRHGPVSTTAQPETFRISYPPADVRRAFGGVCLALLMHAAGATCQNFVVGTALNRLLRRAGHLCSSWSGGSISLSVFYLLGVAAEFNCKWIPSVLQMQFCT